MLHISFAFICNEKKVRSALSLQQEMQNGQSNFYLKETYLNGATLGTTYQ